MHRTAKRVCLSTNATHFLYTFFKSIPYNGNGTQEIRLNETHKRTVASYYVRLFMRGLHTLWANLNVSMSLHSIHLQLYSLYSQMYVGMYRYINWASEILKYIVVGIWPYAASWGVPAVHDGLSWVAQRIWAYICIYGCYEHATKGYTVYLTHSIHSHTVKRRWISRSMSFRRIKLSYTPHFKPVSVIILS